MLDTDGMLHSVLDYQQEPPLTFFPQILAKEFNRSVFARDSGTRSLSAPFPFHRL